MTRAEITRSLRSYLETEFPNEGTELTDSTDLLNEWFIDSLAIVQTVLFLESNFGISLGRADIDAASFKSIDTLAGLIARRLGVE